MKIILQIPATIGNFGPGFDSLGVAIKLYNHFEIKYNHIKKTNITIIGEGEKEIPKDEKNLIYRVMKKVYPGIKNVSIKQINNIPLERGLGSSATAILCGTITASLIKEERMKNQDIIEKAINFEGHPDNIIPAFYGGLCICYKKESNFCHIKLNLPENLYVVLCVPNIKVKTEDARKILPKNIPLSDAVFNCSRVATLIKSMLTKDYKLLNVAFDDKLHQPYRAKLIPGMYDVFESAKKAGAYGVALSGSGSTIFAICSKKRIEIVAKNMQSTFKKYKINSTVKVCKFDNEGTKITVEK